MYVPFEDKNVVSYPCPNHKEASAVDFDLDEVMKVSEAKEKEEIRDIDLDTFIRVNCRIDDNTELRYYKCSKCKEPILFFPESYAKYVA